MRKHKRRQNLGLYLIIAIICMILLDRFVLSDRATWFRGSSEPLEEQQGLTNGFYINNDVWPVNPFVLSQITPAGNHNALIGRDMRTALKSGSDAHHAGGPELRNSIRNFRAPVAAEDFDHNVFFKEVITSIEKERPVDAVEDMPDTNKPRIAIVIDDLGVSSFRTARAMKLNAPLTLAFLPDAPFTRDFIYRAKNEGHDILLHIPMEPLDSTIRTEKRSLKVQMTPQDIQMTLSAILDDYEGFVGINNHMGSAFTKCRECLDVVMQELKERDMIFLDSKTIHDSKGALSAAAADIRFAERDVFVDHVVTKDFIRNSLKKTEEIARRHGFAIAIAHPHNETLDVLEEWIKEFPENNMSLVPLSVFIDEKLKAEAVISVSAL